MYYQKSCAFIDVVKVEKILEKVNEIFSKIYVLLILATS